MLCFPVYMKRVVLGCVCTRKESCWRCLVHLPTCTRRWKWGQSKKMLNNAETWVGMQALKGYQFACTSTHGERHSLSLAGVGPYFQPGYASRQGFIKPQIKEKQAKRLNKVTKGNRFVRLVNVIVVWAQRCSFWNEPLLHMTSGQHQENRSWVVCPEWAPSHMWATWGNGPRDVFIHVGNSLGEWRRVRTSAPHGWITGLISAILTLYMAKLIICIPGN